MEPSANLQFYLAFKKIGLTLFLTRGRRGEPRGVEVWNQQPPMWEGPTPLELEVLGP